MRFYEIKKLIEADNQVDYPFVGVGVSTDMQMAVDTAKLRAKTELLKSIYGNSFQNKPVPPIEQDKVQLVQGQKPGTFQATVRIRQRQAQSQPTIEAVRANPDGSISRGSADAEQANGDLQAGPPYPTEQSEAVKSLQSKLEELGYSVGSTGIDGKYGPRTARAVSAFKRDNNLQDTDRGRSMAMTDLEKLQTAERVETPTPTGNEGGGSAGSAGSSAVGATPDMDTLEMIKSFEGFLPNAYWDHRQWSIGYGSFAGRNRSRPDIAGPISRERAESMLRDQIQQYSNDVERWNRVGNYNWNEGQKGALISFAYNIGSIGQLTGQGRRDNATIARKMLEYVRASGEVLPGLVNRRRVEQQKFIMHTPELRQRS
jgi:GH24 family phage-related lysozyme (muramidase)